VIIRDSGGGNKHELTYWKPAALQETIVVPPEGGWFVVSIGHGAIFIDSGSVPHIIMWGISGVGLGVSYALVHYWRVGASNWSSETVRDFYYHHAPSVKTEGDDIYIGATEGVWVSGTQYFKRIYHRAKVSGSWGSHTIVYTAGSNLHLSPVALEKASGSDPEFFFLEPGAGLKHVYNSAGWTSAVIDSQPSYTTPPDDTARTVVSVCFDGTTKYVAAIVYISASSSVLRFGTYNGSWIFETVETDSELYAITEMHLKEGTDPAFGVVYLRSDAGGDYFEVVYKYKDSVYGWQEETVRSRTLNYGSVYRRSATPQEISMVLSHDDDGDPRIYRRQETTVPSEGGLYRTYSESPADCVRDLLASNSYGLGKWVGWSKVDDSSFQAWRDYNRTYVDKITGEEAPGSPKYPSANPDPDTYEQRNIIGLEIRNKGRAWDIITQMVSPFNTYIYRSANVYKVVIDRDDPPVYTFNRSNIDPNSLKLTYARNIRDWNAFEANFLDESQRYDRNTIYVPTVSQMSDPSVDIEPKYRSINVTGITRESEVRRNLWLKFQQKINLRLHSELMAGIDSTLCEPGDVVYLQRRMVEMSWGGRIAQDSIYANEVYLDQGITLEVGKTYEILVKFASDDSISISQVATPSDGNEHTYLTLNVNLSSIPSKYDIWIVRRVTDDNWLKFRILSISREPGQWRKVELVEHQSSLYSVSPPPLASL
jgi:hypothetical protein